MTEEERKKEEEAKNKKKGEEDKVGKRRSNKGREGGAEGKEEAKLRTNK